MLTHDAALDEDEPLNLDLDDLLQSGRISTVQIDSDLDIAETVIEPVGPHCRAEDREFLLESFEDWSW